MVSTPRAVVAARRVSGRWARWARVESRDALERRGRQRFCTIVNAAAANHAEHLEPSHIVRLNHPSSAHVEVVIQSEGFRQPGGCGVHPRERWRPRIADVDGKRAPRSFVLQLVEFVPDPERLGVVGEPALVHKHLPRHAVEKTEPDRGSRIGVVHDAEPRRGLAHIAQLAPILEHALHVVDVPFPTTRRRVAPNHRRGERILGHVERD
mmetsp:Transcript_4349/g.15042  ORF Transcript_4349/g.15042 Transcript_4349/m.15042 type:complete len:209 (+) Transcript_4349:1423-2049(+)